MTYYTTPSGRTHLLFEDMLRQAHLLIAGASGSGKSVLINGLICTMLYDAPNHERDGKMFILIDPKRTELSPYKDMPHCLMYASEPEDMVDALHYAVDITESRYEEMERNGWRTYPGGDIYVVIEEFADLMTTMKRTVQPLIQRLCQIARAAKVHCIVCTQCPLREIIGTPIKVNFDGIVALRTRCAQDSRNIIGVSGAELLPRYGECLYITPDKVEVEHDIVPYVDDAEQNRIIQWWRSQMPAPVVRRRGWLARLFGLR